jgi:hypothetical protein
MGSPQPQHTVMNLFRLLLAVDLAIAAVVAFYLLEGLAHEVASIVVRTVRG